MPMATNVNCIINMVIFAYNL